ncbi:glycosyltransferase family 4 protein [Dethiobacter alkaliphilus]|uniref:Glycosyl transferase group 1 n=1 Tax=Dethiobacter alkaliphilus AHT 1 TaxID=555088 RepID=C0GJS0_DETAL|nr:glycosyltransferase family 4 protein [Dethiobacter alkaliphilus]EEG76378.1 glycosyl transferase group 1 [Dethiobacter alkaliphilus AHT 1]
MKIGMFTDSYRPYTSGVVRSIETTAGKLTELGHEVYIFAPKYPDYEKEAGVFRFASVPTPTYPDFAIALPFSLYLRSTIKRLNLDVIHVHSPFSMGLLGARTAKRYDLPLVFTYHTMYDQYVHYLPFAQDISRKVVLKLSSNFCNRCDLVITPTEVIRKIVAPNVQTRVEAVPTGIEVDEFDGADRTWLRREYNISPDEKILLHLGRLGKEKNVGFLLQAYNKIRKNHPHTRLVIVGDGPEREGLIEEAKSMDFGEKVLFTGPLSREHVVDSYAGADLFIFASTTETQGLVLGEAKAAGVPSVAVKALGASEMVKDGVDGYLTPLDMDKFTERIEQLLENDELRQAMAERALIEAEHISSTAMAKKLLGVYMETIDDKKRLSAV